MKIILINPSWDEPHHVIYLNRPMGALEIPIGTYHRSISGKEGSIVLNQPKRDKFFDPSKAVSYTHLTLPTTPYV